MVTIPLKEWLELMVESRECAKWIREHPGEWSLRAEVLTAKIASIWALANGWKIQPQTIPESEDLKKSEFKTIEGFMTYLSIIRKKHKVDAIFIRGPDVRFVDFKFKANTSRGIAISKREYDKYWKWVKNGEFPNIWLVIWSNSECSLYTHRIRDPSEFEIAEYVEDEPHYDITLHCAKIESFTPLEMEIPKNPREYWAFSRKLQRLASKGEYPRKIEIAPEDIKEANEEFWEKGKFLEWYRFRADQLSIKEALRSGTLTPDQISKILGAYDRVLTPKNPHKRFAGVSIFGFDTEFHDDRLLSIQLCGPSGSKLITENLKGYGAKELISDLKRKFEPDLAERNYLVAHFATADIGKLEGYLRDFRFKPVNRALHADFVKVEDSESEFKTKTLKIDGQSFKIIDLFAYFPCSLEKIGEMIGLPKLEADRANILEFMRQNPKAFRAYALRDAEICMRAFNRFRNLVWNEFQVEVLKCPTIASVAGEIFRTRFLKEPVAPYEFEEGYRDYKIKQGWSKTKTSKIRFSGSRDVRNLALRAYWGGRAECFVHGLIKGHFRYYDVVSLYPSASMLQPLPNKDTEWLWFNSLDDIHNLEGFAKVEFEFPDNCMYPCLPVFGKIFNRLYFPKSGISYCTIAEIKEALRLGCKIKSIQGYGFKPGPKEIQHPLKAYMVDMLKRKNQSSGLMRETYKLLMNALIGKLAQRNVEANISVQQAYYIQHGVPLSKVMKYKAPERAGPLWAPEWASLILGRARAIMSQFISKGALMTVTDSVLLPAHVKIECEALNQLRSVGSDLIQEYGEIHKAFLIRTRLYALFNESGEIVKEAHHAVHLTSEQVKKIMLKALELGADPEIVETRAHIIKLPETLRTGKPLGHAEPHPSRIYFRWDWKRDLVNRNVNMFRECSETSPVKEVESFERAIWKARRPKRGRPRKQKMKPGRPKEISEETEREIIKLRNQGLSYRAIAKRLGLSLGMVQRAIKRYLQQNR